MIVHGLSPSPWPKEQMCKNINEGRYKKSLRSVHAQRLFLRKAMETRYVYESEFSDGRPRSTLLTVPHIARTPHTVLTC